MRTWLIVQGPILSKLQAKAETLAEKYRKARGTITYSNTEGKHLDDVVKGSVNVLLVCSPNERVDAVNEDDVRYLTLLFGKDAEERASYAVSSERKVIPCCNGDEELRSITLDFEAYYGHITSKRLNLGEILKVKNL